MSAPGLSPGSRRPLWDDARTSYAYLILCLLLFLVLVLVLVPGGSWGDRVWEWAR